MREIAVALLLAWSSAAAAAPPEPTQNADCSAAIATAERSGDIPAGLLAAIGHVESGRPDPVSGAVLPWPWTIDVAGAGQFFATKAEAVAATQELQKEGVASIDVGCMQVNLAYHPAAFTSLEKAFDPLANALYAARFLRVLFSRIGEWPAAVAAYHSQTREIGAAYQGKVLAIRTPPGLGAPAGPDSRPALPPAPVWIERRLSAGGARPAMLPPAPVWIERPLSAGGARSAMLPPAPVWIEHPLSAGGARSSAMLPPAPFAKPAALRQLLAQR